MLQVFPRLRAVHQIFPAEISLVSKVANSIQKNHFYGKVINIIY